MKPGRTPGNPPDAGLLALPAAAWYAAVFALPLGLLFLDSLRGPAGWTGGLYLRFLSSPYNLGVIGRTGRVAAVCTLLCTLIGYPAAFALAAARGRVQSLLVAALLLPLSVSVIVKALGWTVLLRSNGAVNKVLLALHLVDAPVRLLFTEAGLLLGMVSIFLPFLVLPLFAVLRQVDGRLVDAAATLGSSPLDRFLRVTLPLTLPGLLAGATLVFSLSVAAYVIPNLLVGDTFQTLPTVIATSFLFLQDPGRGSVAGVVLLVLCLAVIVGGTALTRRVSGRVSGFTR